MHTNRKQTMKQTTITNGNRAVVITEQGAKVWANLYVNARNGLADASITSQRWTGKSVAGAKAWAEKMVAE
jgi:hypothetical protein